MAKSVTFKVDYSLLKYTFGAMLFCQLDAQPTFLNNFIIGLT